MDVDLKIVIRKDPDDGKDWRQEEKGTTEDKLVRWHRGLNGHEFEQAPGDSKGQGGHGVTESVTTEQLSNNKNCHMEWSKLDRELETAGDIPYMRNLKKHDTDELIYKTETHTDLREWTYGCSGRGEGRMGEQIVREFGMDRYTLLYLRWITNKDLLYRTGNSTQRYGAA